MDNFDDILINAKERAIKWDNYYATNRQKTVRLYRMGTLLALLSNMKLILVREKEKPREEVASVQRIFPLYYNKERRRKER
jgi:hypothetical protein